MKRVSVLLSYLLMLLSMLFVLPASAIEAIDIKADSKVLDLSAVTEFHEADGDRIQVSTAPGPDGIVQRIEVRARQSTTPPGWIVFALTNNSDSQIDRYLVVPHFRMSGSGLLKPDLGAQRVASISTSQGFAPERISDTEADVFQVTLDPGNVVTFVVELSHKTLPGLSLWEPEAYKDYVNSYTFYRGIVLGISGLLALFLIILFVVKGAAMFPAAALLAWSVLAYLAIDFGFMGRLFDIPTASEPIWRAVAEVAFSASILILLFTYLTLHRWHVRYLHVSGIWLIFLIVVLGVALFDPSLGAGIARISMAITAIFGFGVILYLAVTGFDRAIMLIPTWILLLLWLAASGAAVVGILDNDLVPPALSGGLVLLVLLFCFTIMQHAFSGGILAQGIVSDSERRALAVVGAGDMVWDWDVPRDRIYTSGEAERLLGLKRGALDGHARDWLDLLHPMDRDRFSAMLDAVIEQRRGKVNQDFRLRSEDGHYRWFKLRVRPVVGTDGEVVRCVGTLLDITDHRNSEERMLHNAIHDNLTGLANRELLHDRLGSAMTRTQVEGTSKPAVLLIDIDDFRDINDSYGLAIGDSILLTVARRLTRLLKPQDSIARFYGDQFAIILLSEQQPERIAVFADSVRKVLKVPVVFGDKELSLSVSIGIAIHDLQMHQSAEDVINDSELALFHAKRMGGDRIEPFRPSLRQQGRGRGPLDRDLVDALERNEIDVVFQPIVDLEDRQIKGFEALARWTHPQRGTVPPADFIPAAERTGLIVKMGIYVLEQAARQLSQWQRDFEEASDLFMSVNVSSQQLLRHDLIGDVKTVLARCNVRPGSLKLELTESLVMENPEYANQALDKLRELGAGLSLDDFGTGYSSLSYLQHFPFDTLKIDKSFVGHTDGAAPVILQSIINLAGDLDLNLVAEGVENEEAASQLVEMGCLLAQGFLFGKPLTSADATQMLQSQIELAKQRAAELKARKREEERLAAQAKAEEDKRRKLEKKRLEEQKLKEAQERARKVAEQTLATEAEARAAEKAAEEARKKETAREVREARADTGLEEQLAAGLAASIAANALIDQDEPKAKENSASTGKDEADKKSQDQNVAKGTESSDVALDMDLALEDAIGQAAAEAIADLDLEANAETGPEAKPQEQQAEAPAGPEMPTLKASAAKASATRAPVEEDKTTPPATTKVSHPDKPAESKGKAGGFAARLLRNKVSAASDAMRKAKQSIGKAAEAAQKGKAKDDGKQGQAEKVANKDTGHKAVPVPQVAAMKAPKPVADANRMAPQSAPHPQAVPGGQPKSPAMPKKMHPSSAIPAPAAPIEPAPVQLKPAHPDTPQVPKKGLGQSMPEQESPAIAANGTKPPVSVTPAPQVAPMTQTTPQGNHATTLPPGPKLPPLPSSLPKGGETGPAHSMTQANAQPVPTPPVPVTPSNPAPVPAVAQPAQKQEAGKAVPGKPDDNDSLPFAMPDMSGIDKDIAAAIQSAMMGGKKD